LLIPEALSRMIRARLNSPCGRVREAANVRSCSLSSGFKTKGGLGRPIGMGTSILPLKGARAETPKARLTLVIYGTQH
jgi:hypothetical protein